MKKPGGDALLTILNSLGSLEVPFYTFVAAHHFPPLGEIMLVEGLLQYMHVLKYAEVPWHSASLLCM